MMMRYLLLICLIPSVLLAEELCKNSFVIVSGNGRSSHAPDTAIVTLGVIAKDHSAKVAMERVNQEIRKLLLVITQYKISDENVQTSRLSLNQDYSEQKNPSFVGNPTLEVTIKDLSILGDFIGTAVDNGANAIQNIEFRFSNPEQGYGFARDEAFKNAEAKARQLASLSKRLLGPVVSVEESQLGRDVSLMPQFQIAAMKSSSTPVSIGEIDFPVTLTVKYELQ